VDSVVALLVAVVFAARSGRTPNLQDPTGQLLIQDPADRSLGMTVAFLVALPLAARRRYPLAVFWVVMLGFHFGHGAAAFDPTLTVLAGVIAAYSAVIHSPYPVLAVGSGLVGAVILLADLRADMYGVRPGLLALGILVPVALALTSIYTWKQQVRALHAEQRAATRRAVEQERSRIAHDLHDVVTHNVSVMVVQAGAARQMLDSAPELAREAMLAVETGGRAAMAELRLVMGLLTSHADDDWDDDRDGTDADTRHGRLDSDGRAAGGRDGGAAGGRAEVGVPRTPVPGLSQVPDLVRRFQETGAAVVLTEQGPARPLPAGVELAAYRVVQEGLTNVLKHAAGARVDVLVEHRPDRVRVEVRDSGGTQDAPPAPGGGHGLVGLRQRLAIYGGRLTAGTVDDGGYALVAEVPAQLP